jgi:AcrR family transcriptional regulator
MLLDAAIKLADQQGGTRSMGIRELAREAGLNHNTFYRHFDSVDMMIEELLQQFRQELRQGLREARAAVQSNQKLSRAVVGWLFDFAEEHSDIFAVAFREQFAPPGSGRDAVRAMLDQILDDMVTDVSKLPGFAALDNVRLVLALKLLIDHDFRLCMQYLESPTARDSLLVEAETVYETMLAGVVVFKQVSKPSASNP